ncbi:MAG: ABC transporter permease [Anaerolineae bacterium]|nr:ABC transporter permease [Anaerolineae bacterium]
MRHFLVQRVLSALPALLGIATVVFVFVRILPGDPTAVLAAQSGGSAADLAQLRAAYGLDRPLGIQYVSYLAGLVRLDLGRSIFTGQSVVEVIWQQAPETIALALASIGFAVLLGLPLGVAAAARQGSWLDRVCMGASVLGVSIPIAISGLLLVLLFSLTLRWLPATGQGTPLHLLMPAAATGFASAGSIARVVRTQLVEVLERDYIQVARAKGLSERHVLFRHALRSTWPAVLTLVGLQFGFMLSGAVVTESVFARQGLGRTLVDAILYQDYPVVQGVVLVTAALYVCINIVVDLVNCYADPRTCRI